MLSQEITQFWDIDIHVIIKVTEPLKTKEQGIVMAAYMDKYYMYLSFSSLYFSKAL